VKVFLVGATGRTGKWILKAALARGHEVTALVRDAASRGLDSHPSLRVISGDLFKVEDLAGILAGHEALISALNSAVVEAGTLRMIEAAQSAGVRRFLGVAGGGILQLDETHLRRERPGYPAMFVKSSEGHLRAWRALEASSLLWTLVCTPDLIDAPASGLAKQRVDYMPEGGRSVPCGDVAELLMSELDSPSFSRKRVGFTV
jgi:putative NADH-flavin reductase